MTGRTTAEGGRIDRTRILRFRFDGRGYTGYQGDTLASALLASGVTLLGRSFKYHRPRGILSAGIEEPNALVQLRSGRRTEPNVKATQVELFDGLEAWSQNRWPTLSVDLGAVNDLLSPLFPAGFYYKTFMWPKGFWHAYESLIRRMAGLGKAPTQADPDLYDRTYAHADVVVVGGGPAGLVAAAAAARTGARVILADEQREFGGSLLGNGEAIDGAPGDAWVARTVADLEQAAEVRLLRRTTVAGYYDHNFLIMVERVADHLAEPDPALPRQRLWKVRAKQVVLATGAIERPLVFADNDRPGVMLAGAVQTYLRRYAVLPGRHAVVFTNNDSAYPVALDLAANGIVVAAVVDIREEVGRTWVDRLGEAGIESLAGYAIAAVRGRRRVKGVDVMRLDETGSQFTGEPRLIACDLIATSGGWNPTVHLFSQSGGRLEFDNWAGCFVPGEARQAVRMAGAASGKFALADCLAAGAEAGLVAATAAGFKRRGRAPKPPSAEPAREAEPARHLWLIPGKPARRQAKRFVDLQNDVTAADLALATREGYRSIEHVKRYTTAGMGTDQGKTGNVNALAIVAASLGKEVPSVGTTTFRPPYAPMSFGALVGRDRDAFMDPVRKTPMHAWHEANGAVFEPVGQWLRPFYYPRGGETKSEAVDREVKAARTGLGLLDATTLGKIDIQGPDAAEFLNRIYTNGWTSLPVGRCRYGLMLHEDGMVFDDGVTARLGEGRFHMTTTSGNAGPVLHWLDDWLQTEWPELKVYCTSVTEHWAVIAVSGPQSRRLMSELGGDINYPNEAFPFMSVRQGVVAGMPARVFRVSFTGELSYEINVSAGYGLAMWQTVLRAGEKYGITPFGTEAMHVLRAEVGIHYRRSGNGRDHHAARSQAGGDGEPAQGLPRKTLALPPRYSEGRPQAVGRPADG